jgi:hypothetical protein
MKKISLLFLCTLLLAICFISCDLFTGSKVDLYKAIGDEVDWANAPKLDVRIEFPSAWGVSNPAQGGITPAMDIRKGYEFSVEFTPDIMYSLQSWMVFRTERLDELSVPASWVENPGMIIDPKIIQPLGPDEVSLGDFNASDKVFKFIINTTDPVTLVPWCDTEPRITRTEPRHRPDGPPYSRASDITLYFNGALDGDTVRFADSETDDGIWITAVSGDNVIANYDQKWFSKPEYAAVGGFFTVTVKTGANLPPAESLMTVTVRGIRNAQGNPMAESGYSFSWKTSRAVDVELTSYTAAYNDNGSISVSWTEKGADKVETYYRLNNGRNNPLTTADNKTVISGVNKIDASGVREGMRITSIEEYEIYIELYVDEIMENRTSFKIWNFPGMSVAHNNIVKEISSAAQLAAVKDNLSGQYVLANDIAVPDKTFTDAWIPVGTGEVPFKGKFYGNGRTVAISGFTSDLADAGLFGVVSGGIIRDLTVEYADVKINGAVNAGGIAGQIQNRTSMINCIVKGASGAETLTLTQNGDDDANLGGIAGKALNSFICNCQAGLNVELNRSGGIGYAGAVAGFVNGGSGGNITINIGYVNPDGKGPEITLDNLAVEEVTVTAKVSGNTSGESLYIGGAAGGSSGNTMRNVIVFSSEVSFNRTAITADTCVGGVSGYALNSNMEFCSFIGKAFDGSNDITGKIDDLNKKHVRLGGLIGFNETNGGDVYINNCHVWGDIRIDEEEHDGIKIGSEINIGGVLGRSEYKAGAGKVNITNCFFEDGNITAVCFFGNNQAGGFCGTFYEEGIFSGKSHNLNNCGVMAGTVEIEVINYGRYIYAGGFTSQIWLAGITSNCFSRANVISRASGNSKEEGEELSSYTHFTGGFTGLLASGATIKSCYATGTVHSTHSGSRDLNAGGLVGGSSGIIENCYALGNVLADKIAGVNIDYVGATNAGGLVGATWGGGSIQYSFSAGQVISQSKESSANAGGVVGNLYASTIKNTAALGTGVTAKSGTTKNAGRITIVSGVNNYALNSMVIEEDEYDTTAPYTRDAVSNADGRDGQSVNSGVFYNQAFWKTTVSFPPAVWDFSRVGKEGYPRLTNLGGQ